MAGKKAWTIPLVGLFAQVGNFVVQIIRLVVELNQ